VSPALLRDKIILVLDDDPGVATYCQRILEREHYEVICLMDARQAVGVLKQARVDLLLLDIRMPNMDGFQVMELARAHQPDLAVVFMTGYGTLETATRALRQGADGLLLKPFDSSRELLDGVEHALMGRERQKEIVRLQAIQPLLPISKKLFQLTEQDKLVASILESVCNLLDCEHAGLYTVDPSKNGSGFLQLTASRGSPLPGEVSRFDGGPVARADAMGAGVRVPEAPDEESNLLNYIQENHLGAVMCVPVTRGASGRAVLLAGRSREDGSEFSSADLETFALFASQAGGALDNARLYADLHATLDQVKEQQMALIQTEKLAAIGRLTASIAHEVNNPLQAVRNCLHLVGRDDLSNEKRDSYLSLAQDELERLMNTVQQMLDFYRPSALEREWVDIHILMDNVLTLLDNQLDQNDIKVSFKRAEGLRPLYIVRNQMQQVFFNMVLNSMDAIMEHGHIWISFEEVGKQVEVFFKDDGPGVPDEERENIFEPFVSSKPQGVGLGLSVSFMIVDAHAGSLELLKTEDPDVTGACFRITLPIVEEL
jgi:signal transduction histidine kinase/FixJ family two-component response regulator